MQADLLLKKARFGRFFFSRHSHATDIISSVMLRLCQNTVGPWVMSGFTTTQKTHLVLLE